MDDPVIAELTTDDEIRAAFPLLSSLRERLRAETFLDEIRLQEDDGYRLFGARVDGRLVSVAGIRPARTLSRGKHVFIDDLVTLPEAQGKGHATKLLAHLAARAAADGWPRIYLDARASARGFYEKVGFAFLTATPCWIDSARLANLAGAP